MATLAGDYQFSSEPRAVKGRNIKYRESEQSSEPVKIMWDKRIVRGNTYAAMIVPSNAPQEAEKTQKSFKKAEEKQSSEEIDSDINTPDPVEGRQNIDVQTENLPEELSDKPKNFKIETQTDYLIDRPPTPLYTPKKIGEDVVTQVEDGELFDFNLEVAPILEVLIGKSLEQGRMEVLEEEEVEAMRKHQREFEQKRNVKLIEVQKLEAEELRKRDEAERRKVQARTRKEQLQFAHKKYMARILAKKYLNRFGNNATTYLLDSEVFSDPILVAFHDQLIPWLSVESLQSLLEENVIVELLDKIQEESNNMLVKQHKSTVDQEYTKRKEAKENEIRTQQENEARKQRRAEQRIIRQKEREIAALRTKIEEKIVNTGIVVDNASLQIYSDIDGRQTTNIIGTPGGLFGELLQFFSAVEELTEFALTQEQINLLFDDYLLNCLKAPSVIYSNIKADQLAEFIKTFGKPSLTHQNIHLAGDDIKNKILAYLQNINNSIPRTTLTLFWQHPQEFQIREGLYEGLLAAFFSPLVLKDVDAAHPNPLRQKVEIRPNELPEEGKEIALVRIRIPKRISEPRIGEEVLEPGSPKEEISNRAIMINPNSNSDDISVFVVHQAAQRLIRADLCQWIRSVKGFENVDAEKLKIILEERAKNREAKLISMICPDIPVFDFEFN
ncbi:unnamed protein product [Blepharisma stoltei]|uniref:Radial spoke protein 3 n=1 Tax=Blepharisma stoltei TaxID=1481888 RepID=A0AAU9JB48_9CILI|nr:unnamed protein product [Blepharisma stoltei]